MVSFDQPSKSRSTCGWLLLILSMTTLISLSTSFQTSPFHRKIIQVSSLHAKSKKNKPKKKSSGGGFGVSKASSSSSTATTPTVSADKNSLEKQWDNFASITDLEIAPKGNPEDEDYVEFEVVDIFVRCGESTKKSKDGTNNKSAGTKWFRIGKVCTLPNETSIEAALALLKGLIFWTAVHMRMELVAAGGRSGAASLELGFIKPASIYMGSESDGPISEDDGEDEDIVIVKKSSSVKGVQATFGFRPDWNPPGFTYKRREKAAMKKKLSNLDEIKIASSSS